MRSLQLRLLVAFSVITFFTVSALIAVHQTKGNTGKAALRLVADRQWLPGFSQAGDTSPPVAPESQQKNPERLAYATFLNYVNGTNPDNLEEGYFVATRILAYQLLHAPETKTLRGIPFLVLVTPGISQAKRDRLTEDGATVIVVENLSADWIKPGKGRWGKVMAKLRAWELTEYSRILFLDGDTILAAPLDGIFDEPEAQLIPTLDEPPRDGEAPLPSRYLLAAPPEVLGRHKFPPEGKDISNPDYFNAGFFLFAPSHDMFQYYLSLLALPGRFDSIYPEQNLLNYAHRRHGFLPWTTERVNGSMPWTTLSSSWNIQRPTANDFKGGVASLHDKWWNPHGGIDEFRRYYAEIHWKMVGFFQAHNRCTGRHPDRSRCK
ncbi:nucleotide-diphospho-sugar transferase [Cryomyces antarcticus]|nr:hypothetical protein LTR04_006623 [Oleoguttula sp. CCFEE 6159]